MRSLHCLRLVNSSADADMITTGGLAFVSMTIIGSNQWI